MSSWSESARRRRASALFHIPPGSTLELLSFTFLVFKKFRTGLAVRTTLAHEVAEAGLLSRTADSYAS
jgi:hypothetical protein